MRFLRGRGIARQSFALTPEEGWSQRVLGVKRLGRDTVSSRKRLVVWGESERLLVAVMLRRFLIQEPIHADGAGNRGSLLKAKSAEGKMFRRSVADMLIVLMLVAMGILAGFKSIVMTMNFSGEEAARRGKAYHELDRISPHWHMIASLPFTVPK